MYIVQQTATFIKWISRIKDVRTRIAIARRIERAQAGNLGDHKSVDTDVWEMRLPIGPGYRLYFTQRNNSLIILLVGGRKSNQQKDIVRAKKLAKEY